MTGDEFNTALKTVRASRKEVATLLGVHPRTVARWAQGSLPVPKSAENWVRLMLVRGESMNKVMTQLNHHVAWLFMDDAPRDGRKLVVKTSAGPVIAFYERVLAEFLDAQNCNRIPQPLGWYPIPD